MRQACPSVFVRFFPRPTRTNLSSRCLRSLVAAVFCVASLMTVSFEAQAEGEDGGYLIPVEHSSWIPPQQKQASKQETTGTYAALVPPERLDWVAPSFQPKKTLGGFRNYVEAGTITLRSSTPTNCLPGDLKLVLAEVAKRFGTVSIQSTHRTPQRNRRAGGAGRSLHLACRAIDFRVKARGRDVMAFLRNSKSVGGLKMYRNGIIHIDNGTRRTW
jgi:hypothetical protein